MRARSNALLALTLGSLAAGALGALGALGACRPTADADAQQQAIALTGGDPSRGPELMRHYGCASCHTVQGVAGASGKVGPPLTGIAERSYIAGVLPNGPENMVRWITDPKGVDSLTAMPKTGITAGEARDVAANLYRLR